MDVARAIAERRAYRSLAPVEITEELVRDLARCAQLAPTCNNNQPARFVFVWEPGALERLKPAFNKGNAWCHAASLVIAVFTEREADCLIEDRASDTRSPGSPWKPQPEQVQKGVSGAKPLIPGAERREYYLFDTGMQTAFLILRATELGLVAHPIAGYNPDIVREALGIPAEMQVITLVNVGKHADTISPVLSEKQIELEKSRPERLPLEQVAFFNRYTGENAREEPR